MTHRTIDTDLNAITGNAVPSRSVRRARRRRGFAATRVSAGGSYGFMPISAALAL